MRLMRRSCDFSRIIFVQYKSFTSQVHSNLDERSCHIRMLLTKSSVNVMLSHSAPYLWQFESSFSHDILATINEVGCSIVAGWRRTIISMLSGNRKSCIIVWRTECRSCWVLPMGVTCTLKCRNKQCTYFHVVKLANRGKTGWLIAIRAPLTNFMSSLQVRPKITSA